MPSQLVTLVYEPFELVVGRKSDSGYSILVMQSPAGDATAQCQLNPYEADLIDAIAQLAHSELDEASIRQVGTFLFEELFVGDLLILFRASLSAVRAQSKGLQLRLRLEAPELAALPWEFLFDPVEDTFLAVAAEITLTRYIPLRLPTAPLKVDLPLRLLLVLANPRDLDPLDLATERTTIEEALAELIQARQIELYVVEHATIGAVNEALRSIQPQLLHFVGHSLFDQDRAVVALEDEQGLTHLVDEEIFRELFTTAREMRLAVLNACQSGQLSPQQLLAGLAPRLLQRQLSAVVAMQFDIPDQTALIFSRAFYRSLALGYPVDTAITEARRSILLERGSGRPDWGIPVLFLRSCDGQIFDFAKHKAEATVALLPPPAPAQPPPLQGFVGREQELVTYTEQLAARHLVTIAGMPGIGKTMLAAMLAKCTVSPDKLFWHTFHQGENALSLIWKLAAFLAWNGQPDLWNLLQGAQQTGGQSPPPTVLIDYVVQMLKGQHYLLCLDDFHVLYDGDDDDPVLNQLIERLPIMLAADDLRLIIASRTAPKVLNMLDTPLLTGLTREDTQQLLANQNLVLEDTLFNQLYETTEGNAELLVLATHALAHAQEPARVLARLVETNDVITYLLTEVDERLSTEQKVVMSGVAALLGKPGTRSAIESTIDTGGLLRVLTFLTNRYLLTVYEEPVERTYGQHAILQAFYYDLLSNKERQAMHRRAAVYYEFEEDEPLWAAQHYARAGDIPKAVSLATADIQIAINRGQIRLVERLLTELDETRLTPEVQAQVHIAYGELHQFHRRSVAAREEYQRALDLLDPLPDDPPTRERRGHICRRMGELLVHEAPREGLIWVQRGLQIFKESDEPLKAPLYLQLGVLHTVLGDYTTARDTILRGLTADPTANNQLQIDAMTLLGAIYGMQGELVQARSYMERALVRSRQLHDHFRTLKLLTNLGINKHISGDWPDAVNDLREALGMARRQGSAVYVAQIGVNLGMFLLRQGEDGEAGNLLQESLTVALNAAQHRIVITARTNLAHLHLHQADLTAAALHLQAAQQVAEQIGAQDTLPEIYQLQAQIALTEGRLEQALATAQQGVALARTLGLALETGTGLRVMGQTFAQTGQTAEAQAALAESLALLEPRDPHEAAQTKQALAVLAASPPPTSQT